MESCGIPDETALDALSSIRNRTAKKQIMISSGT
jgi:hypothetical protein